MRLRNDISFEHRVQRQPRLKLIGTRGGLYGNSKIDSRLDDFVVECLQTHRIATDDREIATQSVIYIRRQTTPFALDLSRDLVTLGNRGKCFGSPSSYSCSFWYPVCELHLLKTHSRFYSPLCGCNFDILCSIHLSQPTGMSSRPKSSILSPRSCFWK